jgi:predicted nucleic acid-binding protein
LLDTNVYLDALKSAAGAIRFERQFLPLVFQTYLSSVVVAELYAGALDDRAVRLSSGRSGLWSASGGW